MVTLFINIYKIFNPVSYSLKNAIQYIKLYVQYASCIQLLALDCIHRIQLAHSLTFSGKALLVWNKAQTMDNRMKNNIVTKHDKNIHGDTYTMLMLLLHTVSFVIMLNSPCREVQPNMAEIA